MKQVKLTFDDINNPHSIHSKWSLWDSEGGTEVCFSGVQEQFPKLSNKHSEYTFVFTKTAHPEALEITFECDKDFHDDWKERGIFWESDWDCYLDGRSVGFYGDADQLIRNAWDEGYNYVRVEYK